MTQTEADLKQWQQHQTRFQKIFGNEAILDKSFQKIKLKELERIYQKNKKTTDPLEKTTLQWLKAGNKSVEKKLYPRFRQRLWRRLNLVGQRMIAGKPEQVKVKPVPAVPASENWMNLHVTNTNSVKQPDRNTARKDIPKTPRVRVPEAEGNTLHMSRS